MTDIREDTRFEQETVEPKGRFVRSDAAVEKAEPRTPRPRHEVPRPARPLLRPFFRYSYSRDAFVLRAVGRSVGPVLRLDRRRRRNGRASDGIERRAARMA